jgi:enamine deaminase RidA (YjgF/YER057c/UK114 family)
MQLTKKQCITNLGEVLKAAGSSINSVVKVNVFLADMADFGAMNEVYEQVFPS